MSTDDRASLTVLGIALLVLIAFVATAHSTVSQHPPRVQIAPTTTTTMLGLRCFDRNGFPLRTDAQDAKTRKLPCA